MEKHYKKIVIALLITLNFIFGGILMKLNQGSNKIMYLEDNAEKALKSIKDHEARAEEVTNEIYEIRNKLQGLEK